MSWIVDGKTKLEEYTAGLDGTWTPFHSSDDYKYDPRIRPFYQRAVEAKKGIWTPPYVFFGQNVPGITLTAPRQNRGGPASGGRVKQRV
jgi:hypothetical protein